VVSDMEMEIALRIGVKPERIIWNGPFKNYKKAEELLLAGGTVNLDSRYEISLVAEIARKNPEKVINIGIRVNFAINDEIVSRFGYDVESEDFIDALALTQIPNIHFTGFQCHFATRSLESWKPRVEGMLGLLEKLKIVPEIIDLGGGMFGKMPDSLKSQFDSEIPTYNDYAEVVGSIFKKRFGNNGPLLIVEPGSALVGDCMKFAAIVENIKDVRGKKIATILGSIYNINPTLNKKNPPLEVMNCGAKQEEYEDLDFGGFTCIESDYVYRHFKGKLAVGDFVVFGNAGSYSVVLKPPFILPNFPVLEISEGQIEVIKSGETFDDLFHTFSF
ncbi:MAG: pyridoxal-dependent decarboxylase, partial [Candidatus Cloacimonetes bacterium]|nr:pyridoxal-dependent decarboxylase [Candidatus Cloacimonadota bacterium]